MKLYLIQRGYRKNPDDFTGLTGRNGLISLDYMGSAEFEWGAIPKAYRRIMGDYKNFIFIKTKLVNVNNCPLWLYCHKDKVADVEQCIQDYINSPYGMKEFSNLEDHFSSETLKHSVDERRFELKTNFWWDIQQGHDWMAFIGAEDVMSQYKSAISADYNNWWLEKSEEERDRELEEAYRGW